MIVGIPPDYMGKLQNYNGLNMYRHNSDNQKMCDLVEKWIIYKR